MNIQMISMDPIITFFFEIIVSFIIFLMNQFGDVNFK